MSRLFNQPVSESSGHAAQLYAGIKAAVGLVPNAYVNIGSNSPIALETLLNIDGALKKGTLGAKEGEVVKLVVSQAAACDYCLAAHTLIGKKTGLSKEDVLAIREGEPSSDVRLDTLANFTREVISTKGTLPAAALENIRDAGFSDAQIVEIALAVASITFTNLFNRINDTVVDFPPAD
ncbi:carboxymuconolactone decarboxylase family protein [Herbaspirillum rhizosphaerae]|uniref:carboxymuconolactone decarboxylase family protein n=1 Tax=Herbaspirillum rhizosphaerae TaxID=346179 RepID=UPI00067E2AC9|nr:carboxymuconolactone decarboxylase family protein [Herbaspirillum rhizosphaerae]